MEKVWDVVLFGATGFAGRFAARYLARAAPAHVRWTIAGRREEALKQVLQEVRHPVAPMVADVDDPDSVRALAASARVVLSTVGPFSRYGTPLVAACVAHGAHYADITGEVPWVRELIGQYHEEARERRLRIIPMCGFDSVPSDLGVWHLVRAIRDQYGASTRAATSVFTLRGGGLNGGTFETVLTMSERYSEAELANPDALVPEAAEIGQVDPRFAARDPAGRGRWVAPFVMGRINTRVVRRSAWLFSQDGESYGPRFGYQEYQDVRAGARWRAEGLARGVEALWWLSRRSWGRSLLRSLGPKPGQGPDEAATSRGSFRARFRAEAEDGRVLTSEMRSDGDAGNVSTARFLVEAGLTLALDEAPPLGGAHAGGILTPAYALGAPYLDRLRRSGVTLDLDPVRESP